jgi:hypothetical protein
MSLVVRLREGLQAFPNRPQSTLKGLVSKMEINPCYMTRPEELAKYAKLCAFNGEPDSGCGAYQVLKEAFGKQDAAFEFAWLFWNFAHALDDVLDEAILTPEDKLEVLQQLNEALRFTNGNKWAKCWEDAIFCTSFDTDRQLLANAAERDFFASWFENPNVEILGVFTSAIMRCIGGDAMLRSGNPRKMALAPAVSCGDVDVLIHMVFLSCGWEAAVNFSIHRDYDVPDAQLEGRAE